MVAIDIQKQSTHHYVHSKTHQWTTKLMPGEFYVTDKEELLITVLGSCVSACIYDVKGNLGGMNHFMLPHSSNGQWAGDSLATRYGNYAMEHMINELLKKGALKENLRAKIFGGGNINSHMRDDVSQSNIAFVKEYLLIEKIPVLLEDLGGDYSRKVYFTPYNGETSVKYIKQPSETVIKREERYESELKEDEINYDVELF
ncbi:MAG: chemotaxis protein CheD [Magnetococcales bacterium]|nr:chemotaxis protein CheD [Magnetococcales bacterium]